MVGFSVLCLGWDIWALGRSEPFRPVNRVERSGWTDSFITHVHIDIEGYLTGAAPLHLHVVTQSRPVNNRRLGMDWLGQAIKTGQDWPWLALDETAGCKQL